MKILLDLVTLIIVVGMITFITRRLPLKKRIGVFGLFLCAITIINAFIVKTTDSVVWSILVDIADIVMVALGMWVVFLRKEIAYPPPRRSATLISKILYHLFGPRAAP